jgi:hypothetical protein
MTGTIHFDLVSPERLLLSDDVDMVTVPGADGYFGVLAGHAPVMAGLKPGIIEVKGGVQGHRRGSDRGQDRRRARAHYRNARSSAPRPRRPLIIFRKPARRRAGHAPPATP